MMNKISPSVALCPIPMVLVGTEVNDKINYISIAFTGILDSNTISVSLGKIQYSNIGIKENMTMSINIPSEDMVVKTDYIGLFSGAKKDKSEVFESFYGELKGAPMIKSCPICMECEVINIIEMPNHNVFIGRIKNTYCNENVLKEDKIDISAVKPLLFDMHNRKYWNIGKELGDAWSIGMNSDN